MAVIYPKEGRIEELEYLKSNLWYFILWTNSGLTPNLDTEFADLTQPTGGWYSHQGATFSTAAIDDDDLAYIVHPPVVWTWSSSGNEMIYGWAMYQSTDNLLIIIEKFATPKPMSESDHWIAIAPIRRLGDCA